ncbi:unnamed protein product [Kuraishia capsulata CBS 1993]|uniref:Mediator of RNA polymerase II transcription subunit 21 n=1 Tax=Kuraishia capsulata CBS 1993 TaxID=1382522 RepID=W6MQH7_9ASCO|nr:uncharacterized protein KUCA_T00004556001 [Kuraishia capsulata CBS 1993]CDK28573.1 unnamed protein product [Kuraishia capsulata CBS 1993]
MADRLTQLQICLDQLTDMFSAALNYVDQHHDAIVLNAEDPKLVDQNHHPASNAEFTESINELASDIILKTRQILTIIDTLPGVGVTKKEQMDRILQLEKELYDVEMKKKKTIQTKDDLLEWVNELILQISRGIAETRV